MLRKTHQRALAGGVAQILPNIRVVFFGTIVEAIGPHNGKRSTGLSLRSGTFAARVNSDPWRAECAEPARGRYWPYDGTGRAE